MPVEITRVAEVGWTNITGIKCGVPFVCVQLGIAPDRFPVTPGDIVVFLKPWFEIGDKYHDRLVWIVELDIVFRVKKTDVFEVRKARPEECQSVNVFWGPDDLDCKEGVLKGS